MVLVQYRKNDKNNFTVEVDHSLPVGEVAARLVAGSSRSTQLITHASTSPDWHMPSRNL